jgi:hypothetical protein
MTLLVEHDGPLPEQERRRIERFVATLGRQAKLPHSRSTQAGVDVACDAPSPLQADPDRRRG